MNDIKPPKYPLVWEKDNFFIKIFCSIPNIAAGLLLKAGNDKYVIDPGDGILRDLNQEIGKEGILEVKHIFISHGHHDHLGGLWSLLTYLNVMRKTGPLYLYFPEDCIEIKSIYGAFLQVYSKELSYDVHLVEITEPSEINIDSMKIEPFFVCHKEQSAERNEAVEIPSLGFKFVYRDMSICYGGDTAYCQTLADKAEGSNLAIIEAGSEDGREELHMTAEQAKRIGSSAEEYFLVHVPE